MLAIAALDRAILTAPTATRLQQRGEAHFKIADYPKAVADYDAALKLDPERARLYNLRGFAYKEMGETAKAQADFAAADNLTPSTVAAQGDARKAKGDLIGALEKYDRALALQQWHDFYFRRGEIQHALKNYDRAIADFSEALARFSGNDVLHQRGEYLHARGTSYAAVNQPDKALADFDESLKLRPGAPQTEDARARVRAAMAAGKPVQFASTAMRYMPGRPPTGPAAYPPREEAVAAFKRGEKQQRDGLHEAAVASYEEAIRIDPTYADAFRKRSEVYMAQGRRDWAVEDFNIAMVLSKPAAAAAPPARAIPVAGNQTLADYDLAVRNKPDALNYYRRGEYHLDQKNYDQAIADLSEAIRLAPKVAGIYTLRGQAFTRRGENERGMADYVQAVSLYEANTSAADQAAGGRGGAFMYFQRGNGYSAAGNFAAAVADYDRAIKLSPQYNEAYANRGRAFSDLKKYDAALADFAEALRLAPDPYVFYHRGRLHETLSNIPAAMIDYNRALELDPKYAVALNRRSILHRLRGDMALALKDADAAVRLDPKSGAYVHSRGNVYALMQQYDKALVDFEAAYKLRPNEPIVVLARGKTQDLLGKSELALADYNEAIRLNANYAEAYRQRGSLFQARGDLGRAESDMAKADSLAGMPSSADIGD